MILATRTGRLSGDLRFDRHGHRLVAVDSDAGAVDIVDASGATRLAIPEVLAAAGFDDELWAVTQTDQLLRLGSGDCTAAACIAQELPETTFVGFRWRDGQLDALERKLHAGLDAWGKEHYVRSLGGLRTDDDKRNVTRWIEAIRSDPESSG